ncbi:MAG TPA: hypothetical protein V6D31_09195 [Candidatus Sericytochromatia bacterium]
MADFYKARHGKPPGKQLFKNTQSTAIPATDVDLLDEAINKVIAINRCGREDYKIYLIGKIYKIKELE